MLHFHSNWCYFKTIVITINYIDKFSVCVNSDMSKGTLKDRTSPMLMTLTFMFFNLILIYDDLSFTQ